MVDICYLIFCNQSIDNSIFKKNMNKVKITKAVCTVMLSLFLIVSMTLPTLARVPSIMLNPNTIFLEIGESTVL